MEGNHVQTEDGEIKNIHDDEITLPSSPNAERKDNSRAEFIQNIENNRMFVSFPTASSSTSVIIPANRSFEEVETINQIPNTLNQINNPPSTSDNVTEPNTTSNERNPPSERIGVAENIYLLKVWRRSCIFFSLYYFPIVVASIIVLCLDWKLDKGNEGSSCKKPIREWLVILAGHHVLSILLNWRICWGLPNINDSPLQIEMRIQKVYIFYLISRIFDFFWLVWYVLGVAWTFTSQCSENAPHIYKMCVALVGLHSVMLCFSMCCCCWVSSAVWTQSMTSSPPVGGASKKQIKKLETKKYHKSENTIPQEDALCAICLSEYEEEDVLRLLPCHHHFHSECVDQWLLKNKSCPLCKDVIDDHKPIEVKEIQQNGNSDATNETV